MEYCSFVQCQTGHKKITGGVYACICACKAQRFLAIALSYAQQLIILLDRT